MLESLINPFLVVQNNAADKSRGSITLLSEDLSNRLDFTLKLIIHVGKNAVGFRIKRGHQGRV